MKYLNYFLFLYAIILSLRLFGGPIIPLPQAVSVLMTLILIIFAVSNHRIKITPLYLLFFIYLIFSLLLASPSHIFRSWERLLYFITMLSLASPVLESHLFRLIRYKTISYLSIIMIGATLGSFIAYFFGINWMRARYELDLSEAGHFGGLTNQSMTLGPISGISACIFLQYFEESLKKRYLIFALIAFITLFFSASRGALLATCAAICVLMYFSSRMKTFFRKRKILTCFMFIVMIPVLINVSGGIIQKSQDSNRSGLFDSRTIKFMARISEIETSPVYGIGFSAINPYGYDSYDKEKGTIEPGSSILAIVSMTGIIGLSLFISINIQAIKKIKKSKSPFKNLILSLITLFLFHMIVEGYVFAISNPLSIYYWLLLGIANDSKFYKVATKSYFFQKPHKNRKIVDKPLVSSSQFLKSFI